MNEARFSFNTYLTGPYGENCQLTVRGEHLDDFSDDVGAALTEFKARGYSPKAQSSPVAGSGDNTFICTQLQVTTKDGKKKFHITTDASRFPVPVSHYVLREAGRNPDEMAEGQVFSLKGWSAEFEKNAKGYPKWVTKLYQEGAVVSE